LRELENVVLRRREKKQQGWRKTHNEELHNLYFSPDNTAVIT
jgi:hypothetical protein